MPSFGGTFTIMPLSANQVQIHVVPITMAITGWILNVTTINESPGANLVCLNFKPALEKTTYANMRKWKASYMHAICARSCFLCSYVRVKHIHVNTYNHLMYYNHGPFRTLSFFVKGCFICRLTSDLSVDEGRINRVFSDMPQYILLIIIFSVFKYCGFNSPFVYL